MRRLLVVVVAVAVMSPSVAWATDLEELLERGRNAAYTGEQVISCSTPDGVRDALVRIEQAAVEIRMSPSVADDTEVAAGAGGWALVRQGGVVEEAHITGDPNNAVPLYLVTDLGPTRYLGRAATGYELVRDGVPRARLVFDDETGAMVYVATFGVNGLAYCVRQFVSFDPGAPIFLPQQRSAPIEAEPVDEPEDVDVVLPESVGGFTKVDQYEDADGFRFAYYSDGFFSFAVFETPTVVSLPEAVTVDLPPGRYQRSFTAGQATYVWETRDGGMALVGDLPPDLHEQALTALPLPSDPGFFRRLWRTLFG